MSGARPVRGLLFDLDGTLVDTESHTDRAIDTVLAGHGVPGFALPPAETRGRTWAHVAGAIRGAQTGIGVTADALAAELLARVEHRHRQRGAENRCRRGAARGRGRVG